MSMQQISRVVRTALVLAALVIIAALVIAPAVMAQSGASTLDTARARMFLGDWTLTVEGGRGPQDRPLNIKDVDGKVAAELGGARGNAITISDITMPAGDLILKFKQMGRGGEVEVLMALTLKNGGLTVKQTINGVDTTGTGVKGVANARGARGGPRSGPAEGGTAGTVDSVSPTRFAISTPADVMVTIEMTSSTTYRKGTSSTSASAITKGESVIVLGTVNLGAAKPATITASQVIVQPVGEGGTATPAATPAAARVVPFQRGAPSAGKRVGQIPANYTQGAGTIVGGTEANKATVPALAAYPGGIVDRVVRLSTGEYEVHNIGVNWPHHIFVNQDFKVLGAE
jgi:hypothetical protein